MQQRVTIVTDGDLARFPATLDGATVRTVSPGGMGRPELIEDPLEPVLIVPGGEPLDLLTPLMSAELGVGYLAAGPFTNPIRADNLVEAIRSPQFLPFALRAPAASLELLVCPHDADAVTVLFRLLATLTSGGETVEPVGSVTTSVSPPSSGHRTAALKAAMSLVNIEDLFPSHPWHTYATESAAGAYHCLAALFLGLGDNDAALECLLQSEHYEDSPRALALRAIISQERGETLGAVANIVSSLQQYERRKEQKEQLHYLTFSPRNIEVINERLSDGLAALNRRDNQQALSFFAEAVCNFDGFYAQFGIDQRLQGDQTTKG